MDLIFASSNQHKVDEIQTILGNSVNLKSLRDIGCTEEIPETGDTFAANAGQKSWFIYRNYGVNCFADDSGLVVDALGGEPGVYSARYSGERNPEKNLQLVLDRLGDQSNRSAAFITVISLIIDGREHQFEGKVEGLITRSRSGIQGFGYDPIFQPKGYEVTFAEMSTEEKNRISHRAIAMQKMLSFLKFGA